MVIKAKKQPVIKAGTTMSYNPETFKAPENFIETDDPQVILSSIVPFELNNRKFITVDTETHPIDLKNQDMPANVVRRWVGSGKSAKPQDFPFCISICDGTNAYTIYDSLENGFAKFKELEPLLTDVDIEKIFHNGKYDLHMFANAGVKIKGRIHDTVVLAKLVNENRKSFELKKLAEALPEGNVDYEYMVDAYKKTYKIVDYRDIPRDLLSAYANADVWNAAVVFKDNYSKLEDVEALYENELDVMVALWEMERHGMKLDMDYEKPLKEELQTLCDTCEQKIYDLAGRLFNINSGKQLYEVLMELGVDPTWIKKTEKGNPSLDAAALEKLADKDVEMVQYILDFRKASKLLNTYAIGIYNQHDANYKVHGSINQTEATTGRMSITKPALQTLHKKDTRIRKAFIASDDYILWLSDLDQVEYRMFAHYAKAMGLIEAIKKGKDVHTAAAELIFNSTDVTADQRSMAKTVNFALLYGAGNAKMAKSMGVSESEATRFKNQYFAQIPEAQPFIYAVQDVTKQRGYIKNMYGRRRRLTHNEAYKAPNALIQGCAADYLKYKIVDIFKFLKYHKYKSRMVNVIHDELVFEIHKDELHIRPMLKTLLSDFDTYRVPITAGSEVGSPSWGEKKEEEMEFVDIPLEYKNFNLLFYNFVI